MKKTLKETASSFNYLSGVKDLSMIKKDKPELHEGSGGLQFVNTTGKDITRFLTDYLTGKIDKRTFERASGLSLGFKNQVKLTELDDSRRAKFLKDYPPHNPNFPGIEDPTSQAIVIDGKEVDTGTIELDGTEMIQRYGIDDALPDIFASAAQFTDGTELNDEQLSKLTDNYPETIEQIATQMMEEGSCGYSIEGKPANKPAGPHLLKKGELNESVQRMKKLAGIKNK